MKTLVETRQNISCRTLFAHQSGTADHAMQQIVTISNPAKTGLISNGCLIYHITKLEWWKQPSQKEAISVEALQQLTALNLGSTSWRGYYNFNGLSSPYQEYLLCYTFQYLFHSFFFSNWPRYKYGYNRTKWIKTIYDK